MYSSIDWGLSLKREPHEILENFLNDIDGSRPANNTADGFHKCNNITDHYCSTEMRSINLDQRYSGNFFSDSQIL